MKSFFINPKELRLRAGWRILLFIFLTVVIVIVSEFVVDNIFGGLPKDHTLKFFISILLAFIAGNISVLISRKYLDKKTILSFGLKLDNYAVKDWLFGYFLSFIMAGLVFIILLISGLLEFESINPNIITTKFIRDFLLMFIAFCILTAWWEELVFRGYLLQNMINGMGTVWAVIISCIIYGVVHATNPNAGIISSSIIVLFGFMRLYGYLRTSQLWLSMGMHAGWNFFQGPVFGFSASGYGTETLLLHKLIGPTWLTGGKFGPEGSVITILIVLLAILAMHRWSKGREAISWQK